MYTTIELFAGAGGLALGMEQAGLENVLCVEIDHDACATLRQNRPQWNVTEGDIHEVDFTPYEGRVDVVTGGPPCQSFSYSGLKRGFEDTRGTLFREFARCVMEVRPKMFLFENVRGLLSHAGGRTFEVIAATFAELGYKIQYKVMNACFYGVGQKRERMIMIGIREDLTDSIVFTYPRPAKEWTTLRQALAHVPASEGETYSERKRRVMEQVPPGGSWVDLPDDVAREYMGKSYFSGGGRRGMARRISWDEPCLTLTTSPSQKQTERCHPDETRPFTVREYARIQSFPDEWDFVGTVSSKYKQIGNAVPVEMARRVGVQIVKALEGKERNMAWDIEWISEADFLRHVRETVEQYNNKMRPYTVEDFNKNVIDPVKLTFDKAISGHTWEEQIELEIFRQRDKSNNNIIGYFHQRIFQYIDRCEVPPNGQKGGWDVIVDVPDGYKIDESNTVHKIYAEVKNKHNTMNSSSSDSILNKMKRQITADDDCCCMLVQAIATKHQNEKWTYKDFNNRRVRIVSIDEFYRIVTGDPTAFHKICEILPEYIQKAMGEGDSVKMPRDVVIDQLTHNIGDKDKDTAIRLALYQMAFKTYAGF